MEWNKLRLKLTNIYEYNHVSSLIGISIIDSGAIEKSFRKILWPNNFFLFWFDLTSSVPECI